MGSRNPAPLGAKGARGSPSQSHGDPAKKGCCQKRDPAYRATRSHGDPDHRDPGKKGNLVTGILLTGPLRATGILLKKGPC